MTLDLISLVLLLTQALTARARHPGGEFLYRSVPSAGALYPCEVYVCVRDGLMGLTPGLYHYTIENQALTRLRSGDLGPELEGCVNPEGISSAICTFFVTAIFFRSAWKYRERAYRYHLLDCGHLIENLVLALRATHLSFRLAYDFDDHSVNTLLGLDEHREVCLSVVHLLTESRRSKPDVNTTSHMAGDSPSASRVAPREIDYPIIREIHTFTERLTEKPVKDPDVLSNLGIKLGKGVEVSPSVRWPEVTNYAEALSMRRSRRSFLQVELSRTCLYALTSLLGEVDGFEQGSGGVGWAPVCVGLLIGNVEGHKPGLYLLNRHNGTIDLAASGRLAQKMATVCLDQAWLANAALHILFLTNLDLVEHTWGPRGYRYTMMAAGRLGQRMYLGATTLGLGACGVGAFYDNEAAQLMGLNGSSRLLYLVAVGPV
jgi:SagB-type dehydrogenase family enzyme